MVTAELAVALLSVALIAVAALWGGLACLQQVRAGQLAGQVARQEARGAASEAAELINKNRDLHVEVRRDGAHAEVVVIGNSMRVGMLPPLPVRASMEVLLEPGEEH